MLQSNAKQCWYQLTLIKVQCNALLVFPHLSWSIAMMVLAHTYHSPIQRLYQHTLSRPLLCLSSAGDDHSAHNEWTILTGIVAYVALTQQHKLLFIVAYAKTGSNWRYCTGFEAAAAGASFSPPHSPLIYLTLNYSTKLPHYYYYYYYYYYHYYCYYYYYRSSSSTSATTTVELNGLTLQFTVDKTQPYVDSAQACTRILYIPLSTTTTTGSSSTSTTTTTATTSATTTTIYIMLVLVFYSTPPIIQQQYYQIMYSTLPII